MSAAKSTTIFLNVTILLGLLLGASCSRTFIVGDTKGWAFNTSGWENGKKFRAGDKLVFKYDPAHHSVVVVNKSDYDSCTVNGTKFHTGKDKIRLKKGANYFICGAPGHCGLGMKIAPIAC